MRRLISTCSMASPTSALSAFIRMTVSTTMHLRHFGRALELASRADHDALIQSCLRWFGWLGQFTVGRTGPPPSLLTAGIEAVLLVTRPTKESRWPRRAFLKSPGTTKPSSSLFELKQAEESVATVSSS